MELIPKIKAYYLLRWSCAILLPLVLFSCDDIFVKDITSETVTLIAPCDSCVISTRNITLSWEEIEGIEEYEVIIVSPDFTRIEQVVLDSITQATNYNVQLVTGNYQWKVIARNYKGEIESKHYSFTIDSLISLENEIVELITPIDGFATNIDSATFKWKKVVKATVYNLEVRGESEIGTLVYKDESFNNLELKVTLSNEGVFYWGVQAANDSELPTLFTWRKYIYDNTAPSQPSLINPPNNSIIADFPLLFEWQDGLHEVLSSEIDSLYIKGRIFSGDSVFYSYGINALNYSLDTLGKGSYSWFVRTIDAAGNNSSSATSNTFSIN